MRSYTKTISSIALLLAMILCFSGCSIIDYARSAIKRDPVTNEIVTEIVGGADVIVPNNNTQATQSVVVTTQKGTAAQSTTKPGTTAASGTTATTAPATSGATGVTNNETTTSKPNTGVKEEPVKDIMDLLFATDPNTASEVLTAAGFAYDEAQGIFYTPLYPWQRYFGYNVGFDVAAPLTGMYFDTKRIEFLYNDKEWMIQLWKGQYGITAGAEIGLYNRDPSKVMQYDCADDEDLIEMQFDFYNMSEHVFSRGPEKHWWLTGFKVFHLGIPFTITLDMTLKFTDNTMASAFTEALKKQQYTDLANPIKYKRTGSTVRIVWGSMPDGVKL
ncbi:MAG: DUF4474 domain-containing protein [Clostridia bacterium]|nr:DUF4474 domain-containing protein [Clostridia bacterium]